MPLDYDPLALLTGLIDRAKRAGAEAADAVMFDGTSLEIACRMGEVEKLERSEGRDLGLRVLIGKRQAIVSSNDFKDAALDELVERAVATAKAAPEDPTCGIADPDEIATSYPTLDICDNAEPDAEALIEAARTAEAAARAVKGVTNSEGAEAGWGHATIALAASNGFTGSYTTSSHSVSASVLAGEGTAMERDYDYATSVYLSDLRAPEEIGRTAGERAVRRLGARKIKSARVPVVYESRIAGGLARHLSSAINGQAIARGTSFLKDRMGEQVFSPSVSIIDDPHRPRGLRSKPFDAEGLANQRHTVIDKGVLTTWFLDLASARRLGLKSTGNAARGTASVPGPASTNLYIEAGTETPEALIADIKEGLFLTELIGMGVSVVTGDYSRGAAGFWIENGEIAYPVSELTVAGNLKQMFMNMTPANDLQFRYGTDAPTIRIAEMTVAGM